MSGIDEARRWCRELGGEDVDLWRLPTDAVARAEALGRPLREVVQDLVSGELAVRAGRGDGAAQRRLLALWHGEVLRWCRWNAARGVDAEDVAHDVLVRAVGRLASLGRPEGFRPWLWAITWRVLREHERPWRWRGAAASEAVAIEPNAEDSLQDAERSHLVREVLQSLPLLLRTILWHAYVDGRTRAQIAELTGLAEGTVNRKLTDARNRFRERAARRGLEPLTTDVRVHG